MSLEMMALILIGGLLLLLLLGTEIAVAMGVMASLAFVFFIAQPQVQIPWAVWRTLNSFELLAMTLFVFMGAMFSNTGVVRGLFDAADKWTTHLPGGLATTGIVAVGIFSAISGSSVAAAATFTTIVFPEMEKRGYDPKFAIGSIASGAAMDVLIPPSIILIVYGVWESVSVARLFAAAMIPGIILAALLVITAMLMAIRNPRLAPKAPPATWRERLTALRDMLPWIGVILLVLGVIFGGVMTPTESSALGAFLSIVVAFGYRQMSYQALKASFLTAVKVTAMIGFVLFTARLLAFVLQSGGIVEVFTTFMAGLPFGKYGILAIICIMYLILGCFFDSISMMVLTLPFVMPIIHSFGFSPVWWGIIFVVVAEVGLVTPPFGLILFVIYGIIPRYSIPTIAYSTAPFIISYLVMVALVIAFPQLALWFPGILY